MSQKTLYDKKEPNKIFKLNLKSVTLLTDRLLWAVWQEKVWSI